MAFRKTMNVRLGDALSEFVVSKVGRLGVYDNVSEYVRDLVRKDKANDEAAAFERLKAELQRAFAVPDDAFSHSRAKDVIRRNKARRARQ